MIDLTSKKFLITGGHMTPALAVVKELQKRGGGSFLWVGHKYSMEGDQQTSAEYSVVHDELNLPFFNLTTGKLYRTWFNKDFFKALFNVLKIPVGIMQAFWIVVGYRPSIIVSFGGYLAVPVVLAAWIMRIPIVTHEQTIVTGHANKFISRFANKIAISWRDSKSHFPQDKVVFTGNPIREAVFSPQHTSFQFQNNFPTLYITGGNQGAHIINTTVEEMIPKLLESWNIIHQTGRTSITNDYKQMTKLKESLKPEKKGRYEVRDYIGESEIGDALNKADVVISRAGANTICELLALQKRAILIPIPWAAFNEQLRNAQLLEKLGLGVIIRQKKLNKQNLTKEIQWSRECLEQNIDYKRESFDQMGEKVNRHVNLTAAESFVDVIFTCLEPSI